MGRRQVAIEPDKAEEQARERERRKHFMLGRLNDGMAFLRRSYKMEECSRLHSRDASSFPCTDVVTWSQSHGFQMAKRGEGQSAHSEALAKLHLEQRREVADHRVCLNSLASKRRSLDTEIEATQRALDEQQRRQEEGPKCNQEGGPNMVRATSYRHYPPRDRAATVPRPHHRVVRGSSRRSSGCERLPPPSAPDARRSEGLFSYEKCLGPVAPTGRIGEVPCQAHHERIIQNHIDPRMFTLPGLVLE